MAARVTGFKLREVIKGNEIKRGSLQSLFSESLTAFKDDEEKGDPKKLADELHQCDEAIAKLQTALAQFNLSVRVRADGREMSLCEAVKQVGVVDRMEKLWAGAHASSRYSDRTRSKEIEVAVATIKPREAIEKSLSFSKSANTIRAAIAEANAKEVNIEFLDEALVR